MSALVLNTTDEPLVTVPTSRAVVLLLAAKASLVAADGVLRSPSVTLPAPSVIRLVRYVAVPPRSRPRRPTRAAVLATTSGRCAYCHATASTVDHVVPRSRGGRDVWANVLPACQPCNRSKADRLLTELGWPDPRVVASH